MSDEVQPSNGKPAIPMGRVGVPFVEDELTQLASAGLDPADHVVMAQLVSAMQLAVVRDPQTGKKILVFGLEVHVPLDMLPLRTTGLSDAQGRTMVDRSLKAAIPTIPTARFTVAKSALSEAVRQALVTNDLAANTPIDEVPTPEVPS
jgi:hypothetical protein